MGQVAKDNIEIGVVLQGGGALGAYEYGAMDALLELMDEIEADGRTVRLVAVTGVSIGAINAACVVGAKNRADARRRLKSLWSALSLDASHYWWTIAKSDFALFGVHGFYEPRRDVWNFFGWTNFYDTHPMLETLKEHVDFDSLNASETVFVVTAVNRSSGELIRFRNHPHKKEAKIKIGPCSCVGERQPAAGVSGHRQSAAVISGTAGSSTIRRLAMRSTRFPDLMMRPYPHRDESVPEGACAAEEHDRGERSPGRAALWKPPPPGSAERA